MRKHKSDFLPQYQKDYEPNYANAYYDDYDGYDDYDDEYSDNYNNSHNHNHHRYNKRNANNRDNNEGHFIRNTLASAAALSQFPLQGFIDKQKVLDTFKNPDQDTYIGSLLSKKTEAERKELFNKFKNSYKTTSDTLDKTNIYNKVLNSYTSFLPRKNYDAYDKDYVSDVNSSIQEILSNAGYTQLNPDKFDNDAFNVYRNNSLNSNVAFAKDFTNDTYVGKGGYGRKYGIDTDGSVIGNRNLINTKDPNNPVLAQKFNFGSKFGDKFNPVSFSRELGKSIWDGKIDNMDWASNKLRRSILGGNNIDANSIGRFASGALAVSSPLASMLGMSETGKDRIDKTIAIGSSLVGLHKMIPEIMASYYGYKNLPSTMKFNDKIKSFSTLPQHAQGVLQPLIAYGLKKGVESLF